MAIETSSRQSAVAVFDFSNPVSAEPDEFLASLCSDEYLAASSSQSLNAECGFNSALRQIGGDTSRSAPITDTVALPSSSNLIPDIRLAVHEAGMALNEIDLVSVALGPGSFTGLRIGVVAAKTLAYSLGCAVCGINVINAIAFQATCWRGIDHSSEQSSDVAVAVNAGRGQIFAGKFSGRFPGSKVIVEPALNDDPNVWLERLEPRTIITGNAIELLNDEKVADKALQLIPETLRTPKVKTIAALGLAKHVAGNDDDCWRLQPIYSRPSAAEEVRLAAASRTNPK